MYHGLREVRNGRVLYVDMNSFFASVEQQRDPLLRDKPVAVVSAVKEHGTVLAASYEAKALGIKTGTKVGAAFELCPSLLVREPTPALYRATHKHFMRILIGMFGPEVQARSVDEAALFLPPNWYGSEFCWDLSRRIKNEFRKQLGEYIRCSIGIAPNSLLAKVATDLQKPDGLVEISLENLESTLAKLALTDLPGIAERNALRLALRGIYTPLDLYHTPATQLFKQFGIWGQYWWWRLHGFEPDNEWQQGLQKSISHQHVLHKWVATTGEARPVVARMADRLIHRLRRNHFQTKHIWIYMSLKTARPLYGERHFDSGCSSYYLLLQSFMEMVDQFPQKFDGKARKIVIGFNQLIQAERGLQLDLFNERPKQEQLSLALESIRSRFGFSAIQLGNVVQLDQKVAAEQIGFGRIKDAGH